MGLQQRRPQHLVLEESGQSPWETPLVTGWMPLWQHRSATGKAVVLVLTLQQQRQQQQRWVPQLHWQLGQPCLLSPVAGHHRCNPQREVRGAGMRRHVMPTNTARTSSLAPALSAPRSKLCNSCERSLRRRPERKRRHRSSPTPTRDACGSHSAAQRHNGGDMTLRITPHDTM